MLGGISIPCLQSCQNFGVGHNGVQGVLVVLEGALPEVFDALTGLMVDLDQQLVIEPSGASTHFDVAPFRRWAMMNGFDDIGITLSRNKQAIEEYEAKRLAEKPWLAPMLQQTEA